MKDQNLQTDASLARKGVPYAEPSSPASIFLRAIARDGGGLESGWCGAEPLPSAGARGVSESRSEAVVDSSGCGVFKRGKIKQLQGRAVQPPHSSGRLMRHQRWGHLGALGFEERQWPFKGAA